MVTWPWSHSKQIVQKDWTKIIQLANQSQKHYHAKFLWNEDLDGPNHKREKDQWSRIVSTMPRCNLVKFAERLLRKSFLIIYENKTRNLQSTIAEEVLLETNWKRCFKKVGRNICNLKYATWLQKECYVHKIAEVCFEIWEMHTCNLESTIVES